MNSLTCTRWVLALVLLAPTAGLVQPTEVQAQIVHSMSDYASAPPFMTNNSVPNVLLVLDTSGSMNRMAYDTAFDASTTYYGLFEPTDCYEYGVKGAKNAFSPDPAANPATPGTCTNAAYPWSGNLLNYVTMRRIDVVKAVLIGGICDTGARITGSGGAKKKGVCATQASAQSVFDGGGGDATQTITSAQASGLMPAGDIPGSGTVYFYLMGSQVENAGFFCVDDDDEAPDGSGTGTNKCEKSNEDSFQEQDYLIRADAALEGVIPQLADRLRIGLMVFNDTEGGKVIHDVGGDQALLIQAIEDTAPSGWTPQAESIYEGARYFAQLPPAYDAADYTTTLQSEDPYYFTAPKWASTSGYVSCCKSYMILLTDGESTEDENIPASLQEYADGVHGTHCQGVGCAGHRDDYGSLGTHYLDDVAYWAHTTDLRQATVPVLGETGKDLPGIQSLDIYTFFAFGNGSEGLQAAAKAGGFQDIDNDGLGPNGANTPNLTEEWDTINNTTGAAGPDGVPDTYFESSNAKDMQARLLDTFSSILQKAGAGSAASVLASSSTGEGAVYQSFFYPKDEDASGNTAKWTGYTQVLFIDSFGNLREDSNGDGALVYSEDKIVQTRYDPITGGVLLDRYDDADGNGLADSTTPSQLNVPMKSAKSLWEAGDRLAATASSSRKIKTWVDKDNNGIVAATEWIDFTSTNGTTLAPYLRADATGTFTAANIINFVRGDEVAGMRGRQIDNGSGLKVWKLGDIVHSKTNVVAAPAQRFDVLYGDSTYTAFFAKYYNRRHVAYVGANDGMLHAFNGGYFHRGDDISTTTKTEHGYFTRNPMNNTSGKQLGDELFGFIPQELLPHLKWLTQPDYSHVYYVDLTPKATDVRIFTPDADHPNGWGTILMGGLRMGGSCKNCTSGTGAPEMKVNADFNGDGSTEDKIFYSSYFVLDITNPESSNYPKLLWSFSTVDLGLTTSVPSMLRVSPGTDAITDNTNAKWYMMVGSGPTGYNGTTGQEARLYGIDLKTGPTNGAGVNLYTEFVTGDSNSFMGDLLTLDDDLDYRVDVLYGGNVISTGTTPSWAGKLYRLTTGNPADSNTFGKITTPSVWGYGQKPTKLLATFPVAGTNMVGPIPAAPSVARDQNNNTWVFFGTGRYYDAVDKTNTDTQHFFGVKDPVLTGGCTQASDLNCEQRDLVNVSGAKVCVLGTGTCGGTTTQVTGVTGATTIPNLIQMVSQKDGWYTTLPLTGERALVRPIVLGGVVLFPTYVPASDPCSATGESYLYALYYLTGSAYEPPIIGKDTGAGGTEYNKRSTAIGEGMASEVAVHVGHNSARGAAKAFVQKSTGEMTGVDISAPGSIVSRVVTWFEGEN